MRSQFFDIAGVKRGILTGEIHLTDYRAAGNGFFPGESLIRKKWSNESERRGEECEAGHYNFHKQVGCQFAPISSVSKTHDLRFDTRDRVS